MASSSLKVVEKTGKTEMEVTRETNTYTVEIASAEQFGDLVESCFDTDPSDPSFQANIKLITEIYNQYIELDKEDLNRYSIMIEKMSSKHKHDPELLKQITDWCESRKRLIKITDLAADELDQNIQLVYKSQMLSLAVEMLSSLNLDIYQELSSSIASCASSISPTFGLIVGCTLPLVPYLKYMGVVSSFFENLRSEARIHHVLKAMREDKERFTPLKKWFDDTDELEASVKKLFPYEIDKNIVENIEKHLGDLGEERKAFATAVLFIYKINPSLCRNRKLLGKLALFCQSDAAKEWYKRIVTGARPLNLETSMIYFRRELQQLEETDAESGLVLKIGKNALPIFSILPRLLLFGMNGISAYSCYKKIESGSKHRYSIGLRELVKNAESFYHTMEEIRIRRLYVVRKA